MAVVLAAWGGHRLWYGTPYPALDPTQTVERLRDYSQTIYDLAGLEGQIVPVVDRGPCAPTGLRGSLDANSAEDSATVFYQWSSPLPPESGQGPVDSLRAALPSHGWEPTYEKTDDPDRQFFDFAREDNDETLSIRWYRVSIHSGERTLLEVDLNTPCGQLPDDYEPGDRLVREVPPLGPQG